MAIHKTNSKADEIKYEVQEDHFVAKRSGGYTCAPGRQTRTAKRNAARELGLAERNLRHWANL